MQDEMIRLVIALYGYLKPLCTTALRRRFFSSAAKNNQWVTVKEICVSYRDTYSFPSSPRANQLGAVATLRCCF